MSCFMNYFNSVLELLQLCLHHTSSIDTTIVSGSDIVGIDEHMKAISRLLDLNSKENVRLVGIWARGGNGRSALSKFVYQNICQHFQSHCFLGNLRRISQYHQMSHLHKEFLVRVKGECLTKSRFENQKVLLVADDVNKIEQLDALAEVFNCFGPGSIVIITTQDRQLLNSYGVKLVYEVEHLRFQKVRELFRHLSFRKIDISAAFGSGSFLRYDEAKLVDGITEKISKMLFSATPTIGIDERMNELYTLHDLNSDLGVRVTGIWGRGSLGRSALVSFLYKGLEAKEIRTFKDDKELVKSRPTLPELIEAMEGSRIVVVVVSTTYLASFWCLEVLVKILKFEKKGLIKVLPVFYEVNPFHVRRQIGEVAKQFKKHEKRESKARVKSWRDALTYLDNLSGVCSKNWDDDAKLADGITETISNMLFPGTPTNGNNLLGMHEHMNELYSLLDLTSSQCVRVIGIWGRGSLGRSALARHVYENILHNFEAHCLLEDVRRISLHCGESHLQEELLSKMQGEGLSAKISHRHISAIKASLRNKKMLLVVNHLDNIEQFAALAEEFSWFGPGSRIIITTEDKQLLSPSGVNSVYEIELLRCYEVRQLFRSLAFKQRDEPVEVTDEPVGLEPMNLPGINFFSTLKYIMALICDRGQLWERLNAIIYSV